MRLRFLVLLVASFVVGGAHPLWAETLCVGSGFSAVPDSQKKQLVDELRKRRAIGAGDVLGACDTPRKSSRPSKEKSKRCKELCEGATKALPIICSLFPGLSTACAFLNPAVPTVCPAGCQYRYGPSDDSNAAGAKNADKPKKTP